MSFNGVDIESVDAILIVDRSGNIVYSVRYNPRFDNSSVQNDFADIINKSFLEIYPELDIEESTIMNCLKYGTPQYLENQIFRDNKGRVYNTQNLTLPIIKRGKISGAIEISRDITKVNEMNEGLKTRKTIHIPVTKKTDNGKNTAKYTFDDIITKNEEMKCNIEKAKMIANSTSPVLVYGETGTGKELFVQAIHNYSKRHNEPFIAQNCAALPENLFESILFGSVKGSFTGALDRPGLFELADGGTLFLDEINSMPNGLQAKLLRVLQDGVIRRIGDSKARKINVRIITAMNKDPIKSVKRGDLREDLFYRLNVVSIKLLPLRKRKEDISLYIPYFIDKYNKKLGKNVSGISKEVKDLFYKYHWPGNVRELQHMIESSINILDSGNIQLKHLPIYLIENTNVDTADTDIKETRPLKQEIESLEKQLIINALKKTGGAITDAADILGIPRQTLHYKMKKYSIRRNTYK